MRKEPESLECFHSVFKSKNGSTKSEKEAFNLRQIFIIYL